MSDATAYVSVDLEGEVHAVGRLWATNMRGREQATFAYDASWLRNPRRFAIEPALTLDAGEHHTKALFGAFGDSAPDRWGRTILQREQRVRAKAERRAPRTLSEADYLLAVTDEVRQGALRFRETADGPFVREAAAGGVPPLVNLPTLLDASNVLQRDEEETDESASALRLLLAPGSSLGGARPKASVRDSGGTLHIAKFPARSDEWNVQQWESLSLTLAGKAGIETASHSLKTVNGQSVLLVRRFDRAGVPHATRVPFLSAMSAVGAVDLEARSYLELAEFLRRHGAATSTDLRQLWRRIVFSVLSNNVDDHLRNHGFVMLDGTGWRLSPAYDLNPVPLDIHDRYLTTAIGDGGDTTASLDIAYEVAEQFDLTGPAARTVASEVAQAVADWRGVASQLSIGAGEVGRMESAFEHPDLASALRG